MDGKLTMRAGMPRVSIVTPSFNQGRFLGQTIQSVLGQTYPNIEYLVVDGGSTDNSVDVIRQYQSKIAYWHTRPDKGFADAIQQGLARSTGRILAYLNSDDLLAPDAVERAVERLGESSAAVMVYGNRVCIDEDGRLLYYRPALPVLANSPWVSVVIGQESCFWRRDAYESVGGMNVRRRFAIDYDLFSKLALRGPIVYERRLWAYFRKHSASKTITEYRTTGKSEVRAVQDEIWARRVPRFLWILGVLLCRAYALVGMLFVPRPRWPEPLRPKRTAPWRAVLDRSAHEGSLLSRLVGRRNG